MSIFTSPQNGEVNDYSSICEITNFTLFRAELQIPLNRPRILLRTKECPAPRAGKGSEQTGWRLRWFLWCSSILVFQISVAI
jgi:hypothetical protein